MLGVSPAITAGAVISGAYLGRQDLAAVGDHDPDRADGEGRRLRAHQAPGLDVRAGVRHRDRRVLRARARPRGPRPTTPCRRRPSSTRCPTSSRSARSTCCRWSCWPTFDPQGAGVAGVDGLCPVRGRARRVHPARRGARLRQRHGQRRGRVDQGRVAGDGDRVRRSTPGIAEVDQLVSRGGMDSMLLTLWLIFGAVTFGAVLEQFGLIARLVDPMIASAKSTGRLFLTVFACGVRPQRGGRRPVHRAGAADAGVPRSSSPGAASRRPTCRGWPPTAAPSPRPWCRGTRAGPSWAPSSASPPCSTLPYAIFYYASPLLSVLYGYTGFRIEKTEPLDAAKERT